VFDRIRENLKIFKSTDYTSVVNKSINTTMSRTVLTSITTLIVMLCLLLFGGEPTRGFAFALTIGVFTGTYSSIFIAGALTVEWAKKKNIKITF